MYSNDSAMNDICLRNHFPSSATINLHYTLVRLQVSTHRYMHILIKYQSQCQSSFPHMHRRSTHLDRYQVNQYRTIVSIMIEPSPHLQRSLAPPSLRRRHQEQVPQRCTGRRNPYRLILQMENLRSSSRHSQKSIAWFEPGSLR